MDAWPATRRLVHALLPCERALDPERRAQAAALDACIDGVRRPGSALEAVQHDVLAACEPAFVRLAGVLRDSRRQVGPAAQDRLQALLLDAASSPLFGRDPAAARREADAILGLLATRGTSTAPAAAARRAAPRHVVSG